MHNVQLQCQTFAQASGIPDRLFQDRLSVQLLDVYAVRVNAVIFLDAEKSAQCLHVGAALFHIAPGPDPASGGKEKHPFPPAQPVHPLCIAVKGDPVHRMLKSQKGAATTIPSASWNWCA